MKPFMNEDFLLNTETAKRLFDAYAKDPPIFDWHCHLSAKEIFENRQPNDLCELWLAGDHYKWRAMRSAGVDERFITGDAAPFEKFKAFARTLTLAIGNPLFHWSHLELQRYFGITTVLSEATAEAIWNETCALLQTQDFRPQTLIRNSNVAALCTTDDPVDDLRYHKALKDGGFDIPVLPAFRPDKAIAVELPGFLDWIKALSAASGVTIGTFDDLKTALAQRLDFFVSMGCVASDQSVASVEPVVFTDDEVTAVLQKALAQQPLTAREIAGYHFAVLCALGRMYAARGLAMELHLGAMRNNNARMFARLGPDTGFDSIDDKAQAVGLSRLLDTLDRDGALPKTILFTLNPKDNQVFGAMLGNFQSGEAFGKIQFGSGWWFNDNIDGMRAQMRALANLGVLGTFVGMVTDSRSFLSYPRHEYFRRILCDLIGGWVERGLYPDDDAALKTIIEGVCYGNAKRYFGI
ncbi:MAG: glucuronate isomerase [Clostridia bacterium]|nr:glucuronate isomerase [Clostridia bacterium]